MDYRFLWGSFGARRLTHGDLRLVFGSAEYRAAKRQGYGHGSITPFTRCRIVLWPGRRLVQRIVRAHG